MYPDHRIIAVVVTYEPEPDVLGALLQSIAVQVEAVVIVDNGSQRDLSFMGRSRRNDRRLTLIRLKENKGIAAARRGDWQRCRLCPLLHHDGISRPNSNHASDVVQFDAAAFRKIDRVSWLGWG